MRNPNANWRDSARVPYFFIMDARAAYPLLLFICHIRLWTFILCVSVMLVLALLQKFGYTVPVFGRLAKAFIAGPIRTARPWWMSSRSWRDS